MKPTLTPLELACFERYLPKAQRYLEYGAGHSTWRAAQLEVSTVTVESDPEWISRLRADDTIQSAVLSGRLDIRHADIGPTGKLGYPTDQSAKDRWPLYALGPWQERPKAAGFDVIFVDGRFRVACLLASAIHSRHDAHILVHDFWNRPEYHVALPFLDWVESAQKLGVFRPSRRINRRAAKQAFSDYAFTAA